MPVITDLLQLVLVSMWFRLLTIPDTLLASVVGNGSLRTFVEPVEMMQ